MEAPTTIAIQTRDWRQFMFYEVIAVHCALYRCCWGCFFELEHLSRHSLGCEDSFTLQTNRKSHVK